jgi:selenocysteine lyase/cysteine desulfurase
MHGDAMSGGYFLYHSIGQYPGKERDLSKAMAAFASVWSAGNGDQWAYVLGQRQKFIDRWRAIIAAAPGTVTTCENVTQGLHMLVTALPPHTLKGKRILVAGDCFPSNHFLLTGLQERLGFTLDTVPLRQGASWVEDEDMIARWDGDVALALLTWVSSTSSHRIDLQALVAHGRAQGSLVGVDITQAAGLLPFSVSSPEVDFTISTSLKWMCGTPGAGILHVAPGLIAKCHPELRGWFSQDNPFNWALESFALAPDIRRFDNGTPGAVAAIASLPALDWHASQDQLELVCHNRALTAFLIAAIDDLGLALITPRAEAKRGGSLMLRLPGTTPAASVVAKLKADDLHVDARGHILRLSPGVMTTQEGCERLIAAVARNL